MNYFDASSFPIHEIPESLKEVFFEVQCNIKAPEALIFSSLLSTISLACQGKIDVQRNGITSPCSLNFLTVAESGERKTACDRIFSKPIKDFELQQHDLLKSQHAKYRAATTRWEEELEHAKKELRKRIAKQEDTNELEKRIEEIEIDRPIRPKAPKFVLTDVTPQAVAQSLCQWPSAGIISDEGGMIFNSPTASNLGLLNKCWDGDTLHVDRVSSESFTVPNPRLTVSIMTQPKTLANFLANRGRLARDSGFIARCLFAYPPSTQGDRQEDGAEPHWHHTKIYQERILEILEKSNFMEEEASTHRQTIDLSPDAKRIWNNFYNDVETHLGNGKFLSDIRDSASKIAENAVRMAALFHYYGSMQGSINAETITQAVRICNWYLGQFKNTFGLKHEIPIEQQDAKTLEDWLRDYKQRHPAINMLKKNYVAQLGPSKLRNKTRLDAALYTLIINNKIRVEIHGKTKWINLNLMFFFIQQPITSTIYPSFNTPGYLPESGSQIRIN
ncbi:hypothetical protein os1_08930 [Comamonadaceae bacterium OS-1]|nr:hypothetical protein os1_08930 [Comamonadaceae bacterium OS-1]